MRLTDSPQQRSRNSQSNILGLKTRLICIGQALPRSSWPGRRGARQGHRLLRHRVRPHRLADKHNIGKNLIITLDHHDTIESTDPSVLNLNPELDGFSGEKEHRRNSRYMFGKVVEPELRRFGHLA